MIEEGKLSKFWKEKGGSFDLVWNFLDETT